MSRSFWGGVLGRAGGRGLFTVGDGGGGGGRFGAGGVARAEVVGTAVATGGGSTFATTGTGGAAGSGRMIVAAAGGASTGAAPAVGAGVRRCCICLTPNVTIAESEAANTKRTAAVAMRSARGDRRCLAVTSFDDSSGGRTESAAGRIDGALGGAGGKGRSRVTLSRFAMRFTRPVKMHRECQAGGCGKRGVSARNHARAIEIGAP